MKSQSTLEKMAADLVIQFGQADVSVLPSQESLLALLNGTVDAIEKKRNFYLGQVNTIDGEIASIRRIVKMGEPRRGRGAGNNGKLIDYVRNAIKGTSGLKKIDVARAVIKAGFKTPSTLEDFSNSCYVSGIHKLLAAGEVESFRKDGERESFYRIVKKR